MRSFDIARRRLRNQHLAGPPLEKPGDVVSWLGAVQAQDYAGSLWALGLRLRRGAVVADIERALAERRIIRTWPMRGTLHFVAAADVRWILALSAARAIASSAGRYRQLGLDEAVFTRSKKLFARALEGGKQLTRGALYKILEAARISTADNRGLHILSHLAQDGFICFGTREGKQPTFALLDEWAPPTKPLKRDEALAELAGRYFTSHGPATLQDFTWWSGLKAADARAGLEMVKSQFACESAGDKGYWFASSTPVVKDKSPTAYLLPLYDEYTVAYRDRGAVLDPLHTEQAGNGIFSPPIVLNGRIVGTWNRMLKKDFIVITPRYFVKLNRAETRAVALAVGRYGEFTGLPATVRE